MEYDISTPSGPNGAGFASSPIAILSDTVPIGEPSALPELGDHEQPHSAPKKTRHLEDGSNLAGPEGFFRFQQQIISLDTQLRKLCNKARQLGSSVGILSASSRLRERLGRVLYLFRENSSDLFPQKIQRQHTEVSTYRRLNQRHRTLNDADTANLSREDFSTELQLFSQDISNLLECFSQFPEFVDEIPDQSLGAELNRWAKMLDTFQGDLHSLAVQRYLHDSMVDIGEIVDTMTTNFIPVFNSIGIPTVRASQEHSVAILVNQSTVATFFSGVTATMLQFSYNVAETKLDVAVNVFWFISLVFSTSAAVNSLLGLTWMQAIFRSPDHRVPWWVRIWIKRSPLVLLVLSVACFFVGLVMFTYSSSQARVVAVLTTVLSAMCCFGLAVLSTWFIFEQWTYVRFEGHQWLSDVLAEAKRDAIAQLWALWAHVHPRTVWQRGRSEVDRLFKQPGPVDDPEAPDEVIKIGFRRIVRQPTQVSFWLTVDKSALDQRDIARHRWREAIRRVRELVRDDPPSPDSPPPPYDANPSGSVHSKAGGIFQLNDMFRRSREAQVIPRLQRMGIISEPLEGEDVHAALVRSVKFSPDGKQLVTSSYDRKSFVVNIGSKGGQISTHSFDHPKGKDLARQLKWSPDGKMILMCHSRSMALLSAEDGRCSFNRKVDNPNSQGIRSVAWFGEQACLSAEGNDIFAMNLTGEETGRYRIEHLLVRDIAITKDLKWLFCVGKYDDEDSAKSKKDRKAHQIVVYSVDRRQVVQRAPVFHEMCDITLASDDRSALVSFENKAPPQLWQFYVGKNTLRLFLRHTYMPRTPMTFAGLPSILGGTQDELILRAGTAGDINIWDRETTAFLYAIQMPAHIGHLTALAWNRGAEEWMFATGTHNGRVFLWTIQDVVEKRRDGDATRRASSRSELYSRSPASSHTLGGSVALSPLQTARRASAGSRSVSILMAGRAQTDSPVGMSSTPRRSRTSTSYGTVYLSDSDVEDGDRSSLGDDGDEGTIDDSHGRRRGSPDRTSF